MTTRGQPHRPHRYDSDAWTWPVPISPRGDKPRISDGWHPAGDKRFRKGVGHRGVDIMWRRWLPALTAKGRKHPWGSKWYFMLPDTPMLACGPGVVVRAGRIPTGCEVIIDHGDGHGTGYHHMSSIAPLVEVGAEVAGGQPIGIIGGSPNPKDFGLVHCHLDVALDGRFMDPAKWMRKWRMVSASEVVLTVGHRPSMRR